MKLFATLLIDCYLTSQFLLSFLDITFSTATATQLHNKRQTQSSRWTYQEIDNWGDISKICTIGRKQSPIHIATNEAIMDPQLFNDPLQFINYAGTFSGTLENTGHAVTWTINASAANFVPRLAGSGLGKREASDGAAGGYILHQLHFHWGGCMPESTCYGSEHVIDYRSGPMELHLVHYNSKYETMGAAQDKSDGLAVLAFLFTPVETGTSDGDYASLASVLPQISKYSEKLTKTLHFPKILPLQTLRDGVYFRYDGSLTTPPCYESVTWTVFADRIPISRQSLTAFQTSLQSDVMGSNGFAETIENNFRPIQRLGSRVVTTNSRDANAPPGYNPPIGPYRASNAAMLTSSTICKVLMLLLFVKL